MLGREGSAPGLGRDAPTPPPSSSLASGVEAPNSAADASAIGMPGQEMEDFIGDCWAELSRDS